jgi:hypothetical protein
MSRYYNEENPDAPETLDEYETRVRHAIAHYWREPDWQTSDAMKHHVNGMFHCLHLLTGRPTHELRVFFRLDTYGPDVPPLAQVLEQMVTELCDPTLSLEDRKARTKAMAARWAQLRDIEEAS